MFLQSSFTDTLGQIEGIERVRLVGELVKEQKGGQKV
jgi:hypothetical protein